MNQRAIFMLTAHIARVQQKRAAGLISKEEAASEISCANIEIEFLQLAAQRATVAPCKQQGDIHVSR